MKQNNSLKPPAKPTPQSSIARIRVTAGSDRAAGELSGKSGLSKLDILALAAAEGLPLIARKLTAFRQP